jgi:hypothetical protein
MTNGKPGAYQHADSSSWLGHLGRGLFRALGLGRFYEPCRERLGRNKKHNPLLRIVFMGMVDFVIHEIYWLLASASWRLSRRSPISPEVRAMADGLARLGFATVPDNSETRAAIDNLDRSFWPRFDVFQARAPYGYRPAMPVLWRGMMGYPAVSENQIHFDEITSEDCTAVWRMLEATGALMALETRLRCRLSGFNVRAWRYLPAETAAVGRHVDNLPPHAFKLMYFRGLVEPETGALTVTDYLGESHVIAGENLILFFDANRIPHESQNPKDGTHRDCIEVCLMPERSHARRVQYSGFEAEHPFNPFRNWHTPATRLVPLKPLGHPTGRLIAR